MIPRIKNVEPQDGYMLHVVFEGGEEVIYDLNEDMAEIPDFSVLRTEPGLYEKVHLDDSRTCVYWSDRVDLPSDTLLEYGNRIV